MVRYCFFLLIFPIGLYSQTILYSEDFSTYSDGTGIDYSGNIGDYPSSVSKWSLSVSGASLSEGLDYFKTTTVYSNFLLEARDTDGDVIWESSVIDINGYENVYFSLEISEVGTMETEDYCNVYYRLGDEDYGLISNWNSISSSEYTLNDDWSEETILMKVNPSETLQLKVVFNNSANTEKMRLDNVFVKSYESTVWNGTGNWSEESFWSNGIPTSSSIVTISSGATYINDSYEVFTLTIDSGAILNINSSGSLRVDSELLNNSGIEGLVIHSDESGTGELVCYSNNVLGQVEQFITGGSTGENLQFWHYISTPTQGVNNVQDIFSGQYLISYSENDDSWDYLGVRDTIVEGIGYGLWTEENTLITFQGKLNCGEISPSLSYLDESHGWNFVGNPYPCTIDLESLDYSEMDNEVHIWNPLARNYSSYNISTNGGVNGGTRYVAPMQGFFMLAMSEAAQLTFTDEAKNVQGSSFKNANILSEILLEAKSKFGYDEILIQLYPFASLSFDEQYDVHKFSGAGLAPTLSIINEDTRLAIKAIPYIEPGYKIQLELANASPDSCFISVKRISGLDDLDQLILIDNETSKSWDLFKTSYLTSRKGISSFSLGFDINTGIQDAEKMSVLVYGENGSINIKSLKNEVKEIRITDLNGKVLIHSIKPTKNARFCLPYKGLFVVEISTIGQKEVRKIIL